MRDPGEAIFAIDPGPEQSGWCVYYAGVPVEFGVHDNSAMRAMVLNQRHHHLLAIEMIASYGMPVGREVFETCVFIGRLIEAHHGAHRLVYRRDVKMHLCGSGRAKDPHVRQALIDRFGPGKERAIGTKNAQGPLYGMKSHAWAALAVAVTVGDELNAKKAAGARTGT